MISAHGPIPCTSQAKLFIPSLIALNKRISEHDGSGGDAEGRAQAAEAVGQDGSAEQVARPTGKPFGVHFDSLPLILI